MPDVDDFPLQVLLEVARGNGPEQMTAALVKDLYAIQKQHQFDEDPAIALTKMRRRVEAQLDEIQKNDGEAGA